MLERTCGDLHPNPKRAVKLQGALSLEVADRLVLKIKQLKKKSPESISVYINSGGGQVKAFYALESNFVAKGPSGRSNRFVTIAESASSAAAYLLVVGDYACLRENAVLGFHGVGSGRFSRGRIVRREQAFAVGIRMDRENRKIAKKMARRVVFRMAARYGDLKSAGQENPGTGKPGIFSKGWSRAPASNYLPTAPPSCWWSRWSDATYYFP